MKTFFARSVFHLALSCWLYSGIQGLTQTDQTNLFIKVGSYDTTGQAHIVTVVGNYAYLADGTSGLQIIDVTNPINPRRAGGFGTIEAWGVAVSGNYAYVADIVSGFHVIDVSNPAKCVRVGGYVTSGSAIGISVVGNYAYVADWGAGLKVIDVSNPAQPVLLGGNNSIYARGVSVVGNYAYVAGYDSGFHVIDVSNPTNCVLVGTFHMSAYGVSVVGNYAYVAGNDAGLKVIDVSNPAQPVLVGTYDTKGGARGVAVVRNRAYVADYDAGLEVFDVSYPDRPVLVGAYDTSGSALGITVAGNYAYVADDDAGLQIIQISSSANNTTPHAAIVTAQILNGFVVGATLTDSGFGYTNAPVVVIEGDGTGATATASIKDGMIDKVTIDNPGKNYTAKNTFVLIASPPFVPEVSIQVSKVKVNQKVVLGRKYQLESSNNLAFWMPAGSAFTATRESIEQEFDVNETGRYFRLKEVQ